jgi:hypothetical protein
MIMNTIFLALMSSIYGIFFRARWHIDCTHIEELFYSTFFLHTASSDSCWWWIMHFFYLFHPRILFFAIYYFLISMLRKKNFSFTFLSMKACGRRKIHSSSQDLWRKWIMTLSFFCLSLKMLESLSSFAQKRDLFFSFIFQMRVWENLVLFDSSFLRTIQWDISEI